MNPLIRGILRNDDKLEMTSRIVEAKQLGGNVSLEYVGYFTSLSRASYII